MILSSSSAQLRKSILILRKGFLWRTSTQKYLHAGKTFEDKGLQGDDLEYLRLFSWICELSFDVYLKKQIIEQIIDDLRETDPVNIKKKK